MVSVIKKANYFVKGLKEKPIYSYSLEELDQYKKFIEEKYGKIERVWHELYSPDIHLDIYIVAPTKENNYYKLITKGMGAYKMDIPEEIKDYELERAELVMYLPANWNFDFSKEENYWAVRQMKAIGRLPLEEKSWIGFGHTFSYQTDGKIVSAKSTNFSSMLLVDAMDNNMEELDFKLDNKGRINFYQLIPLYEEELQYKQKYGVKALFDVFYNNKLDLVVDINRENYCKNMELINENNELEEELEK